eukprot:TRINITY_DN436_c0_g1_i2.p1 TRINITY_DN436_c0_g1~~TRINITY_DN436_c0_g1_i2.p1  ORF type:complete len:120 (+),score=9.23 TRINITY_DN436_c0_g1_i2:610-969(+)
MIVSPAALRAAEVVRTMKEFTSPKLPIMKVFAKHVKIEEHHEKLSNSVVRICVGTPNRMLKLLEDGSLSVAELKWVIIDGFINAKNLNLLETKDTGDDFFKLFENHFNVGDCSIKLCFF